MMMMKTRTTNTTIALNSAQVPPFIPFRKASWEIFIERVTRDHCPDRKEKLEESFIELGHFTNHAPQNRTDNNLRLTRIHNEIRNLGAKVHPHYDVFICEPNMGLWKVVMQGPPESTHGRIFHSILDRNWTVDTSTKDLIDTVYSLLLLPEFSDPVNTLVTLNYHWNEVKFKEEAQVHIAKHASKTMEQWRQEIVS
ncbi:uncharacterized protein K460DRAFT_423762 [Cucurbitaria berberidis CBS 394.84]|uniref:Uncharacterized protein n=1 Tax=Cucurbitaria berberidis CBS 394.84 TaxID=1168544 RepID=A0A9P4GTF9_9PLEO|nr:uncharacterized protein K460DRAFT_423762 [Cucurbitaria berberidis CBS 394.84]KAF1851176.1 hypothetical protein K460DRAFT_423762 [Cucurbitaria berberidis CBS 394.84]